MHGVGLTTDKSLLAAGGILPRRCIGCFLCVGVQYVNPPSQYGDECGAEEISQNL